MKSSETLLLQVQGSYKLRYRIVDVNGSRKQIKREINGIFILTNCFLRFKQLDQDSEADDQDADNENYSIVYNRMKLKCGKNEQNGDYHIQIAENKRDERN